MNIHLLRVLVSIYCLVIGYSFYDSVKPWMLDDAFISFRYAENWTNGYGLVYNHGEYVEGFTSFLWVAVLSGFISIGFDIITASIVICIISSVVLFFLLMFSYRFTHHITKTESLIASLLLGTCGVFIPWSFSGMETALFTFILTITILIYLGIVCDHCSLSKLTVVGIFCSFAMLCRPEGMLLSLLILFDLLFQPCNPSMFFTWKNSKRILMFLLPIITSQLVYLLFRVSYYGEWMPNTYYVKVGQSLDQYIRGFQYGNDFVWCMGLSIFIIGINQIKTIRCVLKDGMYMYPLMVLLFMMYVIYVGGDSMPAFRFFVPIVPILCLMTAVAIKSISSDQRTQLILVGLLVAWNAYHLQWNWHIHGHILSDRVANEGKYIGQWMKKNLAAHTVMATNTAGSIAYYAELHTIDMLGLTDKHIAHRQIEDMGTGSAGHEKGDGVYVLSLKPDVIQLGSSLGSATPVFRSGKELFEIDEFHQHYEKRVIGLPNGKDVILFFRIAKQ